jgi:hypothetical protein
VNDQQYDAYVKARATGRNPDDGDEHTTQVLDAVLVLQRAVRVLQQKAMDQDAQIATLLERLQAGRVSEEGES